MTPEQVRYTAGLTGKYAKATLVKLETLLQVEQLDPNLRKIVLDGYADLRRELEKILTEN